MPCMFDGLRAIGVDGTGRGKGRAYITVIVGHGRGRVIWAHDGHGRQVPGLFFRQLTPERRASIRIVTGDGAGWIDSSVAGHRPNADPRPSPHAPTRIPRAGSTARGSSGNSCASPSNGPKRNSNDGSAGRPAAASPRSSNHAGRSAHAATTSSQPSGSAVPTPGSKRSTTRSRSPSAWPTAPATRTTPSP